MLNPSLRFELSEVSPSLLLQRLTPQQALLPRTLPSVSALSFRSEDLNSGAYPVGSPPSHSEKCSVVKPDSDVWLKDLYSRKVHSQRIGFTRISLADPLSAFVPFEEFSPRVSAPHLCETSSFGLCFESEQVQIRNRSLECQRTRG
jgi:hypothetical protein